MRRLALAVLALAPATAWAGPALDQLQGDAALHWGPAPASLPRGMTIAILSGNPDQPGPFTLRLRMPPNTTIAPHTHTKDENVTVLQGSIVHETGARLDRARGMTIGTLGFVYLPAEMPHALWTTASSPAEIQVTGMGPFGVNYVSAADDPSRTQ